MLIVVVIRQQERLPGTSQNGHHLRFIHDPAFFLAAPTATAASESTSERARGSSEEREERAAAMCHERR
jgi:hypothetical protein